MAGANPEVVDRILDMTERGKSSGTICRVLGVSRNTVDYHRLNAGHLCRPTAKGPSAPYRRNGVLVRPYSEQEDAEIERLRIRGYSLTLIAAELGRHPSSIFMRLKAIVRRSA